MGGCHGAAGEVAGVTVPKTPFITQDGEPVKEVSAQYCERRVIEWIRVCERSH